MSEEPKQCQRCGSCCRRIIIDEIYDYDLIREPKLRKYVEELRDEPGRYIMIKSGLRPCPFLIVNVGGINHNLCSIYPTRPTICVAFEPGSNPACPLHEKELIKDVRNQ